MRKAIGVIVAIAMCVSMCACLASASDGIGGAISGLLGDVNLGELSGGSISSLLGDLADVDLAGVLGGGAENEGDPLEALAADIDEVDIEENLEEGAKGILAGIMGEENAEEAEKLLKEDNLNVDSALPGLSTENSNDFMSTITGILDSFGLGEFLNGFSMGGFDLGAIIDSVLGGSTGGVAADGTGTPTDPVASNDFLAGIADTLLGGLESIGIDTSVIEGLLDNDIVNFFANLYCGWNTGKPDEPTTEPTEIPTITEPSTEEPTTQPPAPVKTGDTPSVFVALGTLSVAAAAAFVCMKKKRA